MKCIKCIKQTKHYDLDEIRRVDDKDADEKVASGVWKFIPKEEWKIGVRGQIEKDGEKIKEMKADIEAQLTELSIEEKKLKRKKNEKK
jgi:hypothetical protein